MLTFSEMIVRAAMTDDCQPDVQPSDPRWWSYSPITEAWESSDQWQPGYVWTPTPGPPVPPVNDIYAPSAQLTPEDEQARVWSLVELFARGG